VSELQNTVASYPLRERPRAQLMRALYLGGRHAEALTVYREFPRDADGRAGFGAVGSLARVGTRHLAAAG
jgi:DNA-binding SARP family transcriptional activator